MKKCFLLFALLFVSSMLFAQIVEVPNGTPIKLRLSEALLCEHSHQGDSIAFEVAEDVKLDGIAVIKHGALAYGRVIEGTTWARRAGRAGKVAIQLKYVTDVTGREIPITEDRYIQARGRGNEITFGMVSSPNPLWFLMHGKKIKFPEGKIFVAIVQGPQTVNMTKLGLNTAPEQPAAIIPSSTVAPSAPAAPAPIQKSYMPAAKKYRLTSGGTLLASR